MTIPKVRQWGLVGEQLAWQGHRKVLKDKKKTGVLPGGISSRSRYVPCWALLRLAEPEGIANKPNQQNPPPPKMKKTKALAAPSCPALFARILFCAVLYGRILNPSRPGYRLSAGGDTTQALSENQAVPDTPQGSITQRTHRAIFFFIFVCLFVLLFVSLYFYLSAAPGPSIITGLISSNPLPVPLFRPPPRPLLPTCGFDRAMIIIIKSPTAPQRSVLPYVCQRGKHTLQGNTLRGTHC